MEISLDVKPRTELGKGPTGRYRASGLVPAVFYGPSVEPVALLVDAKQMSQALRTEAGDNVLITLNVDGTSRLTIPREVQRHPIRGTILHVDFVNVARDQKISAHVPVHVVGESHGVKEGGVLDQHLHEVQVEAVPTDIPASVEVDISKLGIGDSLHVSDLVIPAGVEVLTSEEELVLAVIEPRLAELEEETEEEAAADASEVPSEDDAGGSEES
ncbi:MAG TPA: 50S ribosomal protein L25/general stress protein Ctc [Actinomycetota bacterium]|nr:50S ribosomal protein L25/general stress protein Ctc [Actinomycetota bacterium]